MLVGKLGGRAPTSVGLAANPPAASRRAGSSTSLSSSRPKRSCSATQPSTQPGTVTARTSPCSGIPGISSPAARSRSASAPAPARPDALSTAGTSSPGTCTSANRSPPGPQCCGHVTARTALAAIAASAALPPARSIATPAAVATWSALETIALRA